MRRIYPSYSRFLTGISGYILKLYVHKRVSNSTYPKQFFEKMALPKFGCFRFFLRFLGDPKNSRSADFAALSWDFEGRAHPNILRGFPGMHRFWNLDFPWFSAIFRGPKKFSKRGFFRNFLGFWRMGSSKNLRNSNFSAVFSGFWRDGPTQKISEPANLSAVFLRFWRDGPTQKIESLDHEPGNREV